LEAYVGLVKGKLEEEQALLVKLKQLNLTADIEACTKRIELMNGEIAG